MSINNINSEKISINEKNENNNLNDSSYNLIINNNNNSNSRINNKFSIPKEKLLKYKIPKQKTNLLPLYEPTSSEINSTVSSLIISKTFNDFIIILLTLFSKIINVIFTIFIARKVSKISYGISTIYLSFIYEILISFPKDILCSVCSFYCQDFDKIKEKRKFRISCSLINFINHILIFLSFFIYKIFLFMNVDLKQYKIHVIIYIISSNIDNFCIPLNVYMNINNLNSMKTFLYFFKSYLKIMIIYILNMYFNLDLYSFTISRLLTSLFNFFITIILFYYYYFIDINILFPSFLNLKKNFYILFYEILTVDYNLLISIKNSLYSYFIKNLMLNYDKIILSFFVNYEEEQKAEYYFVKTNFCYFIDNFIAPSAENFFILLNRIKNFKIYSKNNSNYYNGDFSNEDNQYIKILNYKKNIYHNNISYSYTLLKTSIKMYYVILIIILNIILLIGNNIFKILFTDKWANINTNFQMEIYIIYIILKLIESNFNSYSSAIFNENNKEILTNFENINIFLLFALSISLIQIDISGLIFANIFSSCFLIFICLYLTVRNEIIKNNLEDNKYYDNRKMFILIFKEIIKFIKESFINKITFICSIVTYILFIIFQIIKNKIKFDILIIWLIEFTCNTLLIFNTIIIIFFEKEQFLDVFRLKSSI